MDHRLDEFDRCTCSKCVYQAHRLMPEYSDFVRIVAFCPVSKESENVMVVNKNEIGVLNQAHQIMMLSFPSRLVFVTGLTRVEAKNLGIEQ